MSQIFYWGAVAATNGQWLYPGTYDNAATSAGENLTRIILPRPGTLHSLFMGGGATTTLVVRLAGADTTLTASITGASQSQDLTHRVIVTPANIATGVYYLTVKVTSGGGSDVRCSLVFD